MDLSGAKTSYALMTPQEARERADREQAEGSHTVEMFDYEYNRLDTPVPASLVKTTIMAARGVYLKERMAHPGEGDAALRVRLMEADPRFKAIAATHPRFFEKVTQPELPSDHLQLMLQMIEMRRAQENGMPLELATAQVTRFFNEKVAPVEGAKSQADRDADSAAEIRRAEIDFAQ
jgi:hypothetical protein